MCYYSYGSKSRGLVSLPTVLFNQFQANVLFLSPLKTESL